MNINCSRNTIYIWSKCVWGVRRHTFGRRPTVQFWRAPYQKRLKRKKIVDIDIAYYTLQILCISHLTYIVFTLNSLQREKSRWTCWLCSRVLQAAHIEVQRLPPAAFSKVKKTGTVSFPFFFGTNSKENTWCYLPPLILSFIALIRTWVERSCTSSCCHKLRILLIEWPQLCGEGLLSYFV